MSKLTTMFALQDRMTRNLRKLEQGMSNSSFKM